MDQLIQAFKYVNQYVTKRNERVWNGKFEMCAEVLSRAKTFLEDWRTAQNSYGSNQQHRASIPALVHWSKPPPGMLKCNIDAAFSDQFNRSGYGLCIRDECGFFLEAKIAWYESCVAPNEGEALVLLAALQWTKDLGLEHVIFELDAKTVDDRIHGTTVDVSEFGAIIQECRRALFNRQNCPAVFVKRQANTVAHTLARVAVSQPCYSTYDYVPDFVGDIIMNEMK